MKQSYNRYFPTPPFLAMNSCALDISDESIKYGELFATSHGLRLGRFGHEKIPSGIIVSGKIEKEDELVKFLKDLAKREHLRFVRISLPEEQMYLFTIELPNAAGSDLRETILFQLEEHIPLKASDTTFDYDIISENPKTIFVEVLAVSNTVINSYLSIFKRSNLVPLSFELEAQAIARSVIPRNDKSALMIVDFGEARTGASIANNGRVLFTTTLDIGGSALTNMIAKNFSLSFEEAEKMKLSYGLSSTSNIEDIFPSILSGISVLRDELNRHYIYWKTHEDDGTKHEKLDRIILCGGEANLTGLSNYLQASMMIKVENANAWVNITEMTTSIPDMSFEESFGYTTVLGLALADYMKDPQKMMNVLPDNEKKWLRREYWMRFASVLFYFLALSGVIATFLLFPLYFFSVSKLNIATSKLEAFNAANPQIATQDLNKSINDINSKLNLLSSKEPSSSASDIILKDLLSNLPKGITIFQILYNETANEKELEIHGKAADRVTLRDFKSSLDNNPHIAKTDLPISSFLEKSNIDFTISITMK
ncbi:MAG: pilus assembly protein PilM [Patescibacteria group bacterium]|nr:pilus assembly protein PilM [Patescibacteria group bacterium]